MKVNIRNDKKVVGDLQPKSLAAELRSPRKKASGKRRIGVAKGQFTVPDSFFDPLPDEILKAFNGE